MGRPRKQAAFSVAQWAALNEAFARIKAALSSASLAERDLAADLRAGRLSSAVRRIARDGTETFERLKPSFWKGLTLLHNGRTVRVYDLDPKYIVGAKLWFCVARSDLDKLYPVGGEPPVPNGDNVMIRNKAEPTPSRRKPGPKVTKNWKLHVAAELHRLVEIEHQPPPPASYFADFCRDSLGYMPDIRAIQKLLKELL